MEKLYCALIYGVRRESYLLKSGRNFREFGFDRGGELLFAVEEDSSVIVVELLLKKTRNSVFSNLTLVR